MYRIELAPGEETVFRTIEELAIGVRNGVVTVRARIYHNASQKWLPIEFHPHYKQALAIPASRLAELTARPPERTETLTFAVPRPAVEPPAAAALDASPPHEGPAFDDSVFGAPAPHGAARSEPRSDAAVASAPPGRVPVDAPVVGTPAGRVAVVEQVKVVERAAVTAEPAAPVVLLPPVIESPVLHLPTISYPEFTPVEAPVAELPAGPGRSFRPFQLVGAAVVLALGGYGMMFALSPARGDAGSIPALADRPGLPAASAGGESTGPAQSEPASLSSPGAATSGPATVALPGGLPAPLAHGVGSMPASSGFAPALEPRAIVAGAPPASIVGASAIPAAVDSAIAPAPTAVELDLPTLPGADSMVTTTRPASDSAMKRILKAVNGGKEIPQRP